MKGPVYPEGPWRPASGVQRGSVFLGEGDPLTPGYPSTSDSLRLTLTEARDVDAVGAWCGSTRTWCAALAVVVVVVVQQGSDRWRTTCRHWLGAAHDPLYPHLLGRREAVVRGAGWPAGFNHDGRWLMGWGHRHHLQRRPRCDRRVVLCAIVAAAPPLTGLCTRRDPTPRRSRRGACQGGQLVRGQVDLERVWHHAWQRGAGSMGEEASRRVASQVRRAHRPLTLPVRVRACTR